MAAQSEINKAQDLGELQLALHRLGLSPNYPQVDPLKSFESLGRGQGLQAKRNIPHGTPILYEEALFSIVKGNNLTPPQANREEFLELSCPTDPATAKARFDANAFQMGKAARRRERQGIFPKASRFNHSCVPNAYFSWNAASKALTIHAIVDIPEDQEIFLNYYPNDFLDTAAQRRQKLSDGYKFQCACSACQLDLDSGRASEARRHLMRVYHGIIQRNKDSALLDDRKQLLTIIQAFGRVLQEEGLLYPQLADEYNEEILWYQREMDRASIGAESAMAVVELRGAALQVARRKLDLDVACTGYDSPEVNRSLETIREIRQE